MLLTLILLFFVTTANSVFSLEHHNEASSPKCSTVECEIISNIFVHDLNRQVNPCEDPISYACTNGNFSFSRDLTPNNKAIFGPPEAFQTIARYLTGTRDNRKVNFTRWSIESVVKKLCVVFSIVTEILLIKKICEEDNGATNQNSLRSLKIEQGLIRQCMEFANNDEKATDEIKKILDYTKNVLIKIISNVTWQTIDEELNMLDSEHAFYEIKVSRNPLNPDQNIITLQPPSIFNLVRKYTFVLLMRQNNGIESEVKNILQNFHLSLNDSVKIDKLKIEEEFIKNNISIELQDFLKYFAGTVAGLNLNKTSNVSTWEYTELPNLIMSINKWNETYNLNGTIPEAASIDWLKVFNHEFKTVGIDVNGTELIYIKNKAYFDGLTDIMSFKNSYTLKIAVAAIHGIKTILHRYLNSKGAFPSSEDKFSQRLSVCILDTPFYGASYLSLNSLENGEINSSQRRTVLRNVVESMKSFIQRSKIPKVKKDFFLKRTDELSSIFFENTWNTSYISNYYENYNLTDNYLMSILKFQNMLKRKELRTIRENPDAAMDKVPFSIHSWDNPRDQFVLPLHLYYNKMNEVTLGLLPKYPVEFYYGTYGTEFANYLIKSLNVDKLNNGLTFELISPIEFTFMKYKTEMFDCFSSDSSSKPKPQELTNGHSFFEGFLQGFITQLFEGLNNTVFKYFYRIDDIVEYFGLSIAFEALQSNRRNDNSDVERDRILKEAGLTSDQMFYLSRFKTLCSSPNGLVQFLLKHSAHSKRVSEAFQCPSQKLDLEKCKTLFELESTFLLHDNATVNQNESAS